jgi:hypothetical protein
LPTVLADPSSARRLSPFLGPVLGPVTSGFINQVRLSALPNLARSPLTSCASNFQHTSWRWTYYVVIIWGACQTAAFFLLAPETHVPTVLKMKAAAIRRETGDNRWMTRSERNPPKMGPAIKKSALTPFKLLRDEPMVLSLDIWTAVLLAILYLDVRPLGPQILPPVVFADIACLSSSSMPSRLSSVVRAGCRGDRASAALTDTVRSSRLQKFMASTSSALAWPSLASVLESLPPAATSRSGQSTSTS